MTAHIRGSLSGGAQRRFTTGRTRGSLSGGAQRRRRNALSERSKSK
ncbi:hypothetical protein MZK47_09990 [Microbacterium aerolatum]|nr:hypothetical protein [Microbacterium aerolatum]